MAMKTGPKRKTGPKGPSKYTKKFVNNLADEMIDYFVNDTSKFHLVEFAAHKLIPRQQFSVFANNNQKFSDAIKVIKTICESRIANHAYTMRNPTMALFDLKCNHQWDDKQTINMQHGGNVNINLSYDTVTPEDITNE